MAVKISELENLNNPTANTIVFALDSQINPNTSYQLKLSAIRSFVTNSSYIQANSAFNKANSANVHANSAYTLANSLNITVSSVYGGSNSAYVHANSAYDSGNSTYIYANSAFTKANSAFVGSNSAFDAANVAYTYANSAFTKANSTYVYSDAAFTKANSAYTYADNVNGIASVASADALQANVNSNFALSTATDAYNIATSIQSKAESSYDKSNTTYDLVANTVIPYTYSAYNQANTVSSNFDAYIEENPIVSVSTYYVSGDGLINDTSPIQSAILENQGKLIFIPPGTYLCDTLTLLSNTTICGAGNNTVFLANTKDMDIFTLNASELLKGDNIKIENIRIVNGEHENCNGISIVGNTSFDRCSGIHIKNVNIYSSNVNFQNGIRLVYCTQATIDDSVINGCNTDIKIESSRKIKIINNSLESNISNNIIETSNSNFNVIYGNIVYSSLMVGGANTLSVNNIVNAGI